MQLKYTKFEYNICYNGGHISSPPLDNVPTRRSYEKTSSTSLQGVLVLKSQLQIIKNFKNNYKKNYPKINLKSMGWSRAFKRIKWEKGDCS